MTTRASRNPISTLAALILLLVASVATAQIDARARELLEGLLASSSTDTVDTLDQTMIISLTEQGMEVRTRTFVDYVGRRALIESETMGTVISFVVKDETVFMSVMGMQMPAPPGIAPDIAGIFDRDLEAFDLDARTVTYDGTVSYGTLVTGEQVTVTGPPLVAGASDESDAGTYIFAPNGDLLAIATESEGTTILMVFDEPVDGDPRVGRSAVLYDVSRGGSSQLGAIRFENVVVNGPAPDGVF